MMTNLPLSCAPPVRNGRHRRAHVADAVARPLVHINIYADAALAQRVIFGRPVVDNGEREIYDKAVLIIAKRQPVASDLREIIGSIRIAY